MNTRINYLYRDASNYKVHNTAVIRGELSEEDQKTILSCLEDGEYFIPSQVGLDEERFGSWTEDDHCWFELEPGFAEPTNAAPGNLTCEQLVANFLAAKGNWDDGSEPEPGPRSPLWRCCPPQYDCLFRYPLSEQKTSPQGEVFFADISVWLFLVGGPINPG